MGKEKDMKQLQYITPVRAKTTFVEVWRWGQELERLHARIVLRFARPEPRRRALAYLKGIVSSVECKNGWQLAEHAGEARPDGMQRLFCSAILGLFQGKNPGACHILYDAVTSKQENSRLFCFPRVKNKCGCSE
jgi:hypothetical protein